MSPLVRRGRVIFLVLASLIIIDHFSRMVLALIRDTKGLNLWSSILFPTAVILGVVSLWQGARWLRRLMALWLLVHGGKHLFIIGLLMYQMATVTPPDQADFFLRMSGILFGFPILYGGFCVSAGLALLGSRSLKAFFDHQWETAENPLSGLVDWILSFFKMDRDSRLIRQVFYEYANRTRYPVLTRDILESLDDSELLDAVVDYVDLKVDNDFEREFEIVSSLPRGFQAVYSTWWVRAEVENGGFQQYFCNRGVDWAFMALEGYKLFGATRMADLMARAIDVYLHEEPEELKHFTGDPTQMIEQYLNARDVSALPELDDLFYEIDESDSAVQYVRTHIDEFVTE